MKNTYSAIKILLSLKSNQISRVEINHLIELAESYAFTYLKFRYKNLHKTLLAEDVTLNEIAIDAIAPLFERDEHGVFVKIKDAFEKWQPPIETEEKAQFFLNRLVSKSLEKYVSELLRDNDPFFSKILDSVNYQIEKQGFKKKQILGTTYIIESSGSQKIGCMPDAEFILTLPVELFKNMSNMLPNIIAYLKKQTEKEPVIPLNALINKLKRIKSNNFNFTDNVEFGNELTVESIIEHALNESYRKLNESYLSKGKISSEEKCKIEMALRSISLDLQDGGINPGLYKYFLEQFPDITFVDYQHKYQNMFEYLYKFLRKEIVKQLEGN